MKLFVVILFASMIYVNYIANSKPLGGITTGEISDKYNTLFTPSGFTFSIWGLIYLLIFVFVISYTLGNINSTTNIELLGVLFIITCILNISWLFCWHYDRILLSTIVMVILLVSLLMILQLTNPEGIVKATFSIYAGWISVALIANISILLFKHDITFFMNNEYLSFYSVLIISLLIGGYMVVIEKNYYYGGVFLWAYVGIISKFIR